MFSVAVTEFSFAFAEALLTVCDGNYTHSTWSLHCSISSSSTRLALWSMAEFANCKGLSPGPSSLLKYAIFPGPESSTHDDPQLENWNCLSEDMKLLHLCGLENAAWIYRKLEWLVSTCLLYIERSCEFCCCHFLWVYVSMHQSADKSLACSDWPLKA